MRTAPPSAELLALVEGWMPARRWYPVKGTAVRTVPWLSWELPSPGAASVEVHLLRLVGDGVDLVVQVPLVLDPGPGAAVPDDGPSVVGHLAGAGAPGAGGAVPVTVHDGAAHPAYWAAVLRLAEWAHGEAGAGPSAGAPDADELAGARPLAVEQSNSSVVLPGVAGGGMLKVVRAVALGPNPDVTIPRALAGAGFAGAPRPLAWLTAGWEPQDDAPGADAAHPGAEPRIAHLAVLAELVHGAQDGFDLACALAGRGESFADGAGALGRAVARMHVVLAGAFEPGPPLDAKWLVDDLRRRADTAAEQTPVLAARRDAVRGFHDEAVSLLAQSGASTRLQRIHGDLHLGQVLHGDEGWKILDFEGEPMRPVAERTRPDVALRDVAGMLRSVDYAAAVGHATDPGWASAASAAFLDAYRAETGVSGDEARAAEALLRALLLDKALYEVVYETRNRPAWQHIPLAAVDRLLAGQV
ncbi:maltokinase [Cellulomonas sp. PhB143]|nr:maltokinase [Cellulomonas sp. PhB143]